MNTKSLLVVCAVVLTGSHVNQVAAATKSSSSSSRSSAISFTSTEDDDWVFIGPVPLSSEMVGISGTPSTITAATHAPSSSSSSSSSSYAKASDFAFRASTDMTANTSSSSSSSSSLVTACVVASAGITTSSLPITSSVTIGAPTSSSIASSSSSSSSTVSIASSARPKESAAFIAAHAAATKDAKDSQYASMPTRRTPFPIMSSELKKWTDFEVDYFIESNAPWESTHNGVLFNVATFCIKGHLKWDNRLSLAVSRSEQTFVVYDSAQHTITLFYLLNKGKKIETITVDPRVTHFEVIYTWARPDALRDFNNSVYADIITYINFEKSSTHRADYEF